ncbi:MAG: hypothetical protein H6999_11675 [Hahellaceae bacterium]|nr:hypothetical protein [Hahellaceae bacterium]MCP5170399.1 hypothetical protein [Hahellaceae bacterium]
MKSISDVISRLYGDNKPAMVWWGKQTLKQNQYFQLDLGGSLFTLQRKPNEWHWYTFRQELETNLTSIRFLDQFQTTTSPERYAAQSATGDFVLFPKLADRPVVIKTVPPVSILPGEATQIYVSTALWFGLSLGEESRKVKEFQTRVLSDTWMGPNTMQGELCYASQTAARTSLDELQLRPYRAFTPVRISNKGNDLLELKKFSLPAPLLSLFATESGYLWTNSITVARQKDGNVEINISSGAPAEAGNSELLMEPRVKPDKNALVKTLGVLFG